MDDIKISQDGDQPIILKDSYFGIIGKNVSIDFQHEGIKKYLDIHPNNGDDKFYLKLNKTLPTRKFILYQEFEIRNDGTLMIPNQEQPGYRRYSIGIYIDGNLYHLSMDGSTGKLWFATLPLYFPIISSIGEFDILSGVNYLALVSTDGGTFIKQELKSSLNIQQRLYVDIDTTTQRWKPESIFEFYTFHPNKLCTGTPFKEQRLETRTECQTLCENNANCSHFKWADLYKDCALYEDSECILGPANKHNTYSMTDQYKQDRTLSRLLNSNAAIGTQIDDTQSLLDATNTSLNTSKNDLSSTRSLLKTKTSTLTSKTTDLDTANSALSTITTTIGSKDLTQLQTDLQATKDVFTRQRDDLIQKQALLEKQKTDLENSIAGLMSSNLNLAGAKEKLTNANQQLSDLNTEIGQVKTDIDNTNTQISQTDESISAAKTNIDTATEQLGIFDSFLEKFNEFIEYVL